MPRARYLFVLLAFCRSLLCLKTAYTHAVYTTDARRQLHNRPISIQFGDNIQTERQLRNAVFDKFFENS